LSCPQCGNSNTFSPVIVLASELAGSSPCGNLGSATLTQFAQQRQQVVWDEYYIGANNALVDALGRITVGASVSNYR